VTNLHRKTGYSLTEQNILTTNQKEDGKIDNQLQQHNELTGEAMP